MLLAGFAAFRVWAFAFAFPFFTNVDEMRHVDAVLKYARGAGPAAGLVPYEPETARLLALFGSPEYLRHPTDPIRETVPAPGITLPRAVQQARIAEMEDFLRPLHSLEAGQPPVYYATAGAWLALWRALGLRDAALLFALRALGGLFAFALVIAAWAVLRRTHPDRPTVFLGVPALLAVMPQDALYYVTGDALSPLVGGLAFLGVARVVAAPASSAGFHVLVGLACAAALLTKYPNAALYAAALGAGVHALRTAPAARSRWLALGAAAALPPALWVARNLSLGLGVTGTAYKAEKLGWAAKPVSTWLEHPLFSASGMATFLGDLVASFWRGELAWHQHFLASGAVDAVYVAVTALGVLLACVGIWRGAASAPRRVEALAAGTLGVAVAVLAVLSLAFRFEGTVHPSPAYPYFSNGRLIGGVTVCVALLLVRGFEVAAARLPAAWRATAVWGAIGGVAVLATGSEVALSLPVFESAYNAYALVWP